MVAVSLLLTSPAWANSPRLSYLIGKIARQEGLDPNLLSAVVATESQFDVSSVSTRGAVGLMQLMPDTARELGVVNRFNPEQNLRGGARYLRKMMERYPGNLSMALAAYNAGPSAVLRFGGIPPFPETKRYIHKVLGRYAKMVPGRDRPPKKSAHHIEPGRSSSTQATTGTPRTPQRDGTARHAPEPPVPAPLSVQQRPAVTSQSAIIRKGASKKGGYAPVIRLTRR